tara:strand:+ start:200 stop:442 length:243 start_codon:yes stop_codon:yes gene_type:complete
MAKSKEEIKAYHREYAKRNKEKIKVRRAKDYLEKGDIILKQQREAYKINPEKKKQKVKEYYEKNKKQILERQKNNKKNRN